MEGGTYEKHDGERREGLSDKKALRITASTGNRRECLRLADGAVVSEDGPGQNNPDRSQGPLDAGA